MSSKDTGFKGFPEGVIVGQTKDIFGKFLEENPAKLHENASVLFLESMMDAFPEQFKRVPNQ